MIKISQQNDSNVVLLRDFFAIHMIYKAKRSFYARMSSHHNECERYNRMLQIDANDIVIKIEKADVIDEELGLLRTKILTKNCICWVLEDFLDDRFCLNLR